MDTPGDVNLDTFNLTQDDYLYKIPYIKMANRYRYSILVLETQTPWAKDPEELGRRNWEGKEGTRMGKEGLEGEGETRRGNMELEGG